MPLNTLHTPPATRSSIPALSAAGVLLTVLAAGGIWASSLLAMAPSAVPAHMAVEGKEAGERHALTGDAHAPQLRLSQAGPAWKDLTAAQRDVLMPLHERWSSMGALAKRRWLVLADRYPRMNAEERSKLASRMHTWATLSSQQRNQARINFESTKGLSKEALQAKWDEYQALSEAEKKRLAEQARKTRASKISKRKLAQVPAKAKAASPSPAPAPTPLPAAPPMPLEMPQAAPSMDVAPLPPAPEGNPSDVSTQPVEVPFAAPALDIAPLAPLPPSTPLASEAAAPHADSINASPAPAHDAAAAAPTTPTPLIDTPPTATPLPDAATATPAAVESAPAPSTPASHAH